jgi:hypothetical protein
MGGREKVRGGVREGERETDTTGGFVFGSAHEFAWKERSCVCV